MRRAFIIALLFLLGTTAAIASPPPTSVHLTAQEARLRAAVYKSDPCLAPIIDLEDSTWNPTVNYGGGHGDTAESYGLGQADPGTKMSWAGSDWRTNPWTQLRWMRVYVKRYGGPC